ncbi:MAG: recombination mediator RecR [Candidatus Shapirobacteria bacterium]|nr:recombination mediator RecR [Candidatus Shapirobacteria bacterium]
MAKLPRAVTELVNNLERLPGIGPKSATRLAFYLLTTPEEYVAGLADSIVKIKSQVKICQKCWSVAEDDICEICQDKARDKNLICVVERVIDMVALENVGGYNGVYHVLGGAINPLEHVGPEDLKIGELIDRIRDEDTEIILATNSTMEGEATALYIKKKLENLNSKSQIKITRIGSGLPIGADLEYADQATLARAMEGRREI